MFFNFIYVIDFMHPKSEKFWKDSLDFMKHQIKFSGLWIDENEITATRILFSTEHKYYNIPFWPAENLYTVYSLDPDSLHYGDYEEYNIKSLSSVVQAKYTFEYLNQDHPFPFILTRGNGMGGGQYAAHFLPDLWSNWTTMKIIVGSTIAQGMFGFPQTGADICGFNSLNKTDSQLCARWYQLGTFLLFSRNHHQPTWGQIDNYQEPYKFSGDIFTTIKMSLKLRYTLLKYMLSLFFSKPGNYRRIGLIIKPIFFNHLSDPNLPPYGDPTHERQFLFGDDVMVAAILDPNITQEDFYFPDNRWYDMRYLVEVPARSRYLTLNVELPGPPYWFLKGGGIVFV
jgi:alpha-glucosidase